MTTHVSRQAAFTGGEIAPFYYGRTAEKAYQEGLRLAENFFTSAEGMLMNRPGTRFITEVQDSTYAPRLISFSFTDGQTFVLEIGNHYLRVLQNGGIVNGVVVTGAVPWAIDDVMRLKHAQNGDVITFACSYTKADGTKVEYVPYEVQRISNTDWRVVAVSYSPQQYFGPELTFDSQPASGLNDDGSARAAWQSNVTYASGQFVTYGGVDYLSIANGNLNHLPSTRQDFWQPDSWLNGTTYARNDYVYRKGQLYISLASFNRTNIPESAATWWALASDTSRPSKSLTWILTVLYRDSTGQTHETMQGAATLTGAVGSLGDGKWVRASDRPTRIGFAGAFQAASFSYTVLGFRLYAGVNGVYGLVGSAKADATFYLDEGAAVDFGTQPPRGDNPFDIATGANTKTQSYPGAVTYYDQRAIYARSDKRPQDFWGSAIGDYKRFDVNIPVQDTDSFNFRPASERLEEIRSLIGLRHLLLLTGESVWQAEGAGEGAISAASIVLRRASREGATFLDPVIANEAAIYQTTRGRFRDLVYDWRLRSYFGRDLSSVARHLFDSRTMIDSWYAQHPWSLFYSVRDDGTLLAMTYASGAVNAWQRWTTGGVYERGCSVVELDPSTGAYEDAVYVVVRRIINGAVKRYIERFSSRLLPQKSVTAADGTITYSKDVRLCNFLDCSLQYDGRQAALSPGTTVRLISTYDFSGTGGPVGASDFATGGGIGLLQSSANLFTALSLGSSIILDANGDAPQELTVVYYGDAQNVLVQCEDLPAAANLPGNSGFGAQISDWAQGAKTITGLSHIEGQTVNALLDGSPAGPFIVAGGQIVLGGPAAVAQVGLPYTSKMELLDLAADQVKPNVKSVTRAFFEVVESRGMFVGESFDNTQAAAKFYEPQLQKVADRNAPLPLYTGQVPVVIAGTWNVFARMAMKQTDPLPVTIVAAIREVVLGGR